MKKIILLSLFLTGCDLVKDLKYQYYYKYQGKILCRRVETIKEQGEYATKIKQDNDPHSYTLSRLDSPEVMFLKEDQQDFIVRKIEETDKSVWLRKKNDNIEITWIFMKAEASLTEIVLEEGDRVNVVVNKFSCK